MKKAFVLILSVFPMIASGDYLDDKIADLTKQKLEKIAELEECQKSTKGLKIAGITTLGISTVGIAANIGEAVALKKLDGQISEAETKLGDLDEQIQDKKDENERKEQQANTCGGQQCDSAEKDAKIATLNGVKSAVSSAISMLKAKAAVKGLSKGCGKLCISGDCPHGDVISCGDDASPNEAPENYVVWVNGHFSANAALKDIQKITDIDEDLDISFGGPAQNLCIQFKNNIKPCQNFIGDHTKGYAVGEDADACMVHLWLDNYYTTVEVVKGGC
jgi:hypothetical protein